MSPHDDPPKSLQFRIFQQTEFILRGTRTAEPRTTSPLSSWPPAEYDPWRHGARTAASASLVTHRTTPLHPLPNLALEVQERRAGARRPALRRTRDCSARSAAPERRRVAAPTSAPLMTLHRAIQHLPARQAPSDHTLQHQARSTPSGPGRRSAAASATAATATPNDLRARPFQPTHHRADTQSQPSARSGVPADAGPATRR